MIRSDIDSNTNKPSVLRLRLLSRFRSNARHLLWIAINYEYALNNEEKFKPIFGHFCTCKTGARTRGHVLMLRLLFGIQDMLDSRKM